MPMAHSPPPKRTSVKPLQLLEVDHEVFLSAVIRVTSENPLTLDSPESLRSLINNAKTAWRSYHESSTNIIEKYLQIASLEQAQQIREEKQEKRTEVKQLIQLSNEALRRLNEDLVSNIDTLSVTTEPEQLCVEEVITEEINPSSLEQRYKQLLAPSVKPKEVFQLGGTYFSLDKPSTSGHFNINSETPKTEENIMAAESGINWSKTSPFTTGEPFSSPHTYLSQTTRDLKPPTHNINYSSKYSNPSEYPYVTSARPLVSFCELPAQSIKYTSVTSSRPFTSFCDISARNFKYPSVSVPSYCGNPVSTHTTKVTIAQPSTFCSEAMHRAPQLHARGMMHPNVSNQSYYENLPRVNKSGVPQHSLDAATVHLIKQELFKQSTSPFDGDPRRFRSWVMLLENRMKSIHLDSLDVISVLLANTTGEPYNVIQDYLAAGAALPDATLQRIWDFLFKEYGSAVKICQSIQRKLQEIPDIRPPQLSSKMKDLIHQCRMIEANMPTNTELQIFDLNAGQRQVWSKLPDWLQRKWRSQGHKFSLENMGATPPFQSLVDFMQYSLDELLDPNFEVFLPSREVRRSLATNINPEREEHTNDQVAYSPSEAENSSSGVTCLYHDLPGHSLANCRSFNRLTYQEKQKFAWDRKLCYRCLGKHLARNCNNKQKCSKCQRNHIPAMHSEQPLRNDEEVNNNTVINQTQVKHEEKNALCSVVCGDPYRAFSCSKTVLCEIHHESVPECVMRIYAVIDDCSDSSYVSEKVINKLKLQGEETRYLLSTMSSLRSEHKALVVDGLWIRGIDKDKYYSLPKLYSSNFIPGSIYEVGTPSIVKSFPHICELANRFVELDSKCEPLLLLGRDAGNVIKSNYHGDHSPFVCETPLGYSLIGSSCPNDQANNLKIKTVLRTVHEHYTTKPLFPQKNQSYSKIFDEREDDDSPGLSKEDQKFLKIVESTIHVNNTGHITISLPFKDDNIVMPNNKLAVYHRTKSTLSKLRGQPDKFRQCVNTMTKNIEAGHIERVPREEIEPQQPGKAWWLPIFAVTHPKKGKHRLVFDSSAKYKDVSLNQVLLQGPDENNRLRGVLMRFRSGEVAFGGDIESMFYNFHLPIQDRDFLRFFWFENDESDSEIVQYRGRVHLFGNKPSPAIAHAGLQYTTRHPHAQQHQEVITYIKDNIYVDDLLAACNSEKQAIENLKNMRNIFGRYHIRLCKIISNRQGVMNHFPDTERACGPSDVDIGNPGLHRALGLAWHIKDDQFIIKVELNHKPFTRRGILSVTNSIYDPLGMVGPVVLKSKLLQRRALTKEKPESTYDWDEPLPTQFTKEWQNWLQSLSSLDCIKLKRSYIPDNFGDLVLCELHTFTDASEHAVGAVAYLKLTNDKHEIHVSYIISSTKLVPRSCTSVPRSELCAALLGSELRREIVRELNISIDKFFMYSDSRVVLSYLSNSEKRFSKYVSHRVSNILKITEVSQWQYINTFLNPADIACRPCSPQALSESVWFKGPDFLWLVDGSGLHPRMEMEENLPEVVDDKVLLKTDRLDSGPFIRLYEYISSFVRAIGTVVKILQFCDLLRRKPLRALTDLKGEALKLLILAAQLSSYKQLIHILKIDHLPKPSRDHHMASLDPFIDNEGIIRVGGRLRDSYLSYDIKHPILLPYDHPLSTLIVRHYHSSTQHQGRHLTLGAVRTAGFFIHKSSKLIRSVIKDCVFCRKLRGKPAEQLMASLPLSRIENTTPFYHTGCDVFGPFQITDGKTTRQSKGSKKIWGLILTCMASRAIHIEPLCGLDTSSLTNALRRFIAIRGACRHLYSDRGTNFVGKSNQEDSSLSLEDVKNFIELKEVNWHFNPPHASHFGGAWERKIGALRRVFEGSMVQIRNRLLSRDEFTTFLLEAMAIVNNTPMWEITSDPKDPLPISPAMLLTLKEIPNPPSLKSYSGDDVTSYGAKRWRRVQFLAECFWQRWKTHYLSTLQDRSKWTRKSRNAQVGDVVLIVNKNEKRNSWPLAIVSKVKVSTDGLVRSVMLETVSKNGPRKELERPICEVIVLVPNK